MALFLELMIIRWSPSVVRLIAYYANLMLISSFLGLGVGAMLAARGRDLLSWFPFLLALEIGALWISQRYALPSSATEVRFYSEPARLLSYVVLVTIFASNALTFVPLGQGIGALFQLLPPLRAYSWDLGGSLAGTIAFGVFSFMYFSPIIAMACVMALYLAISPLKRWVRAAPLLAAVLVIVWWSNDPAAVWSPYYYIRIRPTTGQAGQLISGAATVSEPVPDLRHIQAPPPYSLPVHLDLSPI